MDDGIDGWLENGRKRCRANEADERTSRVRDTSLSEQTLNQMDPDPTSTRRTTRISIKIDFPAYRQSLVPLDESASLARMYPSRSEVNIIQDDHLRGRRVLLLMDSPVKTKKGPTRNLPGIFGKGVCK